MRYSRYFGSKRPTARVCDRWVGRDKTSRAEFCSGVEKCSKTAQNPTRKVHALLGATYTFINI